MYKGTKGDGNISTAATPVMPREKQMGLANRGNYEWEEEGSRCSDNIYQYSSYRRPYVVNYRKIYYSSLRVYPSSNSFAWHLRSISNPSPQSKEVFRALAWM